MLPANGYFLSKHFVLDVLHTCTFLGAIYPRSTFFLSSSKIPQPARQLFQLWGNVQKQRHVVAAKTTKESCNPVKMFKLIILSTHWWTGGHQMLLYACRYILYTHTHGLYLRFLTDCLLTTYQIPHNSTAISKLVLCLKLPLGVRMSTPHPAPPATPMSSYKTH